MRTINTLLFFGCLTSLPAQWTWVPRASLGASNQPRWGTCEFVIGGKAYVVGGRVGTNDVNEVWAYDPLSDTWEAKAPIPGERRLAAAFAINGKGYVACGLVQTSTMLADLLEYDPVADAWTQRAPLPDAARYSAAAFAVGGKGYIVGGNQGGANGPYSTDTWAYDPTSNAWSELAPIPGQTLFAASGFTAEGKGYVLGGRLADQTFSNALWQYDPVTNSWQARAALPGIPRTYSYSWSLDYHGLIMAGDNLQGQQLNDLWRYLPSADSWTSFTPYTGGGTWGGAAFAIGGRVYAGFGRQGSGAVNDLMELRDAFTSMHDIAADAGFLLAPNPCAAGSALQVRMPSGAVPIASELVLHDSCGREVARIRLLSTKAQINLPELAPGYYMVSMEQSGKPIGQQMLAVE